MMPGGGDKKEVKAKSLKALEKLGHKNLTLDEYESTSWIYCTPSYHLLLGVLGQIASEIIHPDDIEVGFEGRFGPFLTQP